MTNLPERVLLSGVLLTAMLTVGCQSGATAPPLSSNRHLQPEYDASGRLTRLTYDRDEDGKPDAWGYMDGSRVVRVEVDEDSDGKPDRWEYYKPSAGAPVTAVDAAGETSRVDPSLERIERSEQRDGRVSRKEFFDNGTLVRVEEDTDGNGTIDKWETYKDGALAVMELDTQGHGRPDRRFVYGPDGSMDHIEADCSGSGTFTPVSQ